MKFDHVHVKCRDLEKAVKYYERVFDAKIIMRQAPGRPPMVRLNLGGIMLILSAAEQKENLPEPEVRKNIWSGLGLGHFGVVVEDLEKTVREMKSKGAEFLVEPRESQPGIRIAFVKGPEEDVIEIIQRDKPLVF
jgi:catechol 2,3-dioxygenase-like lactoylglutathione lyase family enzyme